MVLVTLEMEAEVGLSLHVVEAVDEIDVREIRANTVRPDVARSCRRA